MARALSALAFLALALAAPLQQVAARNAQFVLGAAEQAPQLSAFVPENPRSCAHVMASGMVQTDKAGARFTIQPLDGSCLVVSKEDSLSLGGIGLRQLPVTYPDVDGPVELLLLRSRGDETDAAYSRLLNLAVAGSVSLTKVSENFILAAIPAADLLTHDRWLNDLAPESLSADWLSDGPVPEAPTDAIYEALELTWTAEETKISLMNALDGAVYMRELAYISGNKPLPGTSTYIKTRYTYADDFVKAGDYIVQYLKSLNYFDSVEFQNYTISGKSTRNIVAVKRGATTPKEIVTVGAHYDSTSQSASTLAPGAVDDGSGTAGVMAFADALAKTKAVPARTLHLALFSGEEQGLYGSKHYASVVTASGYPDKVIAGICMDMIGYSNKYFGVTVEGSTNTAIKSLMNLVVNNAKSYSTDLTVSTSDNSFGSDHVSLQKVNIPAVLLIELDDTNYFAYHKTTDTIDNVNEKQSMSIMRTLVGAAHDLAF